MAAATAAVRKMLPMRAERRLARPFVAAPAARSIHTVEIPHG
jgi:hypothetical protein